LKVVSFEELVLLILSITIFKDNPRRGTAISWGNPKRKIRENATASEFSSENIRKMISGC
jgi:hypothetical protein